jgi:hypothetical protein
MKLYHAIPNSHVAEVLSAGFPEAGRVRLTDRPPAVSGSVNGEAWMLFDIPEEEIADFEFDELGSAGREFAISAEVLNRYPIVAIRQNRTLPAGRKVDDAVTPTGLGARRRWIAVGAAVLLAAGGITALIATRGGEKAHQRAQRHTSARSVERGRAAPPAQPSGTRDRVGSVAVGTPQHGRLIRGVPLPASGAHHFTWDAAGDRSPNPSSRRYGTDYVVRSVLRAVRRYRRANPGSPRVGIGDLSGPHGGDLGVEAGGHENGLDVAVLYPRSDGGESEAAALEQVDRRLAQALLDEFAKAGAVRVSLDPRLGLTVPKGMVQVASNEPRMHLGFSKRP